MTYFLVDSPAGCGDLCRESYSEANAELFQCVMGLEQCYAALTVNFKTYKNYCESGTEFVIQTGAFDYLQMYGFDVTLESDTEDIKRIRKCSNEFKISAIEDVSCVCDPGCDSQDLTHEFVDHAHSNNPSSFGRFVARFAFTPPQFLKLTPLHPEECTDFTYSFLEVNLGGDNLEKGETQIESATAMAAAGAAALLLVPFLH